MSKKARYSLNDFLKAYGTEEKCYQHMVKLRWETSFQAPNADIRNAASFPHAKKHIFKII